MDSLKATLRADLTTSMKARDSLRTATLRMALAAVGEAEVAGPAARELSDDDVKKVLTQQVRRRREAAEAFAAAGRTEQAEREQAESAVLESYLPSQLSDEELGAIVTRVLADTELSGPRAMGQAMKAVQAEVAGRAEGARVAALVRAQLTTG